MPLYYGFGYGMDMGYLLVALVALVIGGAAQAYIRSTYSKWSRVPANVPGTGADVARRMLAEGGAEDVGITRVAGSLTDHYDPRDNRLHLSDDNYRGASVASVAVACHEAGHAIQHAQGYSALGLRSSLVPLVNLASPGAYIFFLIGLVLNSPALLWLGIICFGMAVLFSLVTLPVEYDASRRAKQLMVSSGIVTQSEAEGAGEVLSAAFLTYVASAVTALLTLLYFLFRSGLLGRRD